MKLLNLILHFILFYELQAFSANITSIENVTNLSTSSATTEIADSGITESIEKSPAILCYFADWTSSREGKGKFTPENINLKLCTHFLYAFALYNEAENKIVPANSKNDIENGYYQKLTSLRKQGKKVVLSLGGWNDSTEKYGRMLRDECRRNELIKQITEFVIYYEFDGLDLDIEYIGAYQGNTSTGNPNDKEYFIQFLQGLRSTLDENSPNNKLLLSIATPASASIVNIGYDVPKIAALCDHIGVMAYDLHGNWESFTGLVAPFKPRSQDTKSAAKLTVTSIMKIWMSKGAPANKLAVGIPAYGRSFRLVNAEENGIGAPAKGVPDAGKYTKEAGMLGFYEIIDNVKNQNWTLRREDQYGSYAFLNDQWVGFDDKLDVGVKANYIKENGFFGAMIWSLDTDCFQEGCPGGQFTLLRVINNIFAMDLKPASFNEA